MTPPENHDQRGANGSTSTGSTPPWQRVGKDSDEGVQVGAQGYGGRLTEEGARFPEEESNGFHGGGHVGEQQTVVTGTAANRLFGGRSEQAPEDEQQSAKGRESVSTASAGSKGRAAPTALRRPGRGPRRASLQIKRFDPWSVLKLSLVLGVAMFFVWLVAVGVLYTVLDGMGVWDKLNGTYSSLVSGEGGDAPTDPLISAGRVFGVAAILGAINIVLVSALATVSAFIYNVSADLAGGLEVTLSERE